MDVFLLIHREKPNKEDINAWHVDVPNGVDCVVFDTKTNRIICIPCRNTMLWLLLT